MSFPTARLSMVAATLLLPILVQAVAFSVNSFEDIATGKPVKLTWWGNKTPVTIKLMQGPPEALDPVVNIASNIAGESYTWTPTTIAAGTYVLSITQGTETNYSPQFAIANPAPGAAPAGKKPSSTAKAGGVATGAPGHVPPSAMIAAYYPPAGYNNGSSRAICGFDASTSDHFSCASNLTSSGLGHYPAVAGGVGKKDVAVGAAVVGLVVAIVLVL